MYKLDDGGESMSHIKLVRSRKNRMIAGVFGGLESVLKIDVTVLRLVFVLTTLFTGFFPCIFVYILMAIIIPEEDREDRKVLSQQEKPAE